MDKPEKDADGSKNDDNNLDELLDSSLDYFDKPLPKVTTLTSTAAASSAPKEAKASSSRSDASSKDGADAWGEEFKKFQNVMEQFLEDESDRKKFQDLMQSFEPPSGVNPDNFAASFADTIKGLTENIQNIPEPSEEDLANLLNELDMSDMGDFDGDQIPNVMPLMNQMMQKLMSKELLYPSVKDIVDKYPDWLSSHRATLPKPEYEKFERQYDLLKLVCAEFENDLDNTEGAKKVRFEKVLHLMQKIQNCGNPPQELLDDLNLQNLSFSEPTNPNAAELGQQCTLM